MDRKHKNFKELMVEFLATGDELLDGSTSDTNSKSLALRLAPYGVRIQRGSVVRDNRQEIVDALRAIYARTTGFKSTVVFVSGGLGPTSDDITLEAAAQAFAVPLVFSKKAESNILNRLKRIKRSQVNLSNLKQAWIPKGAVVLENQEGTAPGVLWDVARGFSLIFLPGVPREFDHLAEVHVLPWIKKTFRNILLGSLGSHTFYFNLMGWPESVINEFTKTVRLPKGVGFAFRTRFPINQLKVVVQSHSKMAAEKMAHPVFLKIKKKFGNSLFSQTQEPNFQRSIFESLLRTKNRIAIAESCTGGLLSSLLTQNPGASDLLDRSFITYSNQAKIDLLKVRPATLKTYGAVSSETAHEMALGALNLSIANKAVAITGIAGPGGGTKAKPVGLVYVCVAKRVGKKTQVHTVELRLGFDRAQNQIYSAYRALEMLRDF